MLFQLHNLHLLVVTLLKKSILSPYLIIDMFIRIDGCLFYSELQATVLIYFDPQIIPDFWEGPVSPSFLNTFVTFWHNKMFQASLVSSLPQPWNRPFLHGVLIFFCRRSIVRSQDPAADSARCSCSVIASRPLVARARK